MQEHEIQASARSVPRRKLIFGTRLLLFVITLAALGFGWFAHEHGQAQRQTILIDELARSGMISRLDEMTTLSQIVKKFSPSREAWLRGKIGDGWFDHPSIFMTFKLHDDQVPQVVERLRELGTVQEVHYGGDRLTEAGISRLRDGLPGVNVVPNAAPDQHRFSLASMGEHMAYGALGFMIVIAVILLTLLVLLIRWVAIRFRVARLALDQA